MSSALLPVLTIDDFPKPADRESLDHSDEPSYTLLLRWVKQYFVSRRGPTTHADAKDADEPEDAPTDAFDSLMHPKPVVRISSRLPLMLQVG